ncbi:hypothetical protein CAAN3_04S06810 [[Candida] anglica]
MANKRERAVILDAIEDEYRHDLALHLYSTFLLHQINPFFPRRNWASWPVPFEQVPDPGTEKKYVLPENIQKGATIMPSFGVLGGGSIKRQLSIEPEEDDTLFNEQYVPITSIIISETLTDPLEDLRIELKALLERKIQDKLRARGKTSATEIQEHLLDSMVNKMMTKITGTLDTTLGSRLEASRAPNSTRLLNWQDIIAARIYSEEEQNCRIDTNHLKQVYTKCEKLFRHHNYKYEYEDNEDLSDEECIQPEFEVNSYLDHVESISVNQINYSNFKERVLNNKEEESRLAASRRGVIMNKLNVYDRLHDVSWEDNLNITGTKSRSRLSLNKNEQRALLKCNMGINEDTYII